MTETPKTPSEATPEKLGFVGKCKVTVSTTFHKVERKCKSFFKGVSSADIGKKINSAVEGVTDTFGQVAGTGILGDNVKKIQEGINTVGGLATNAGNALQGGKFDLQGAIESAQKIAETRGKGGVGLASS